MHRYFKRLRRDEFGGVMTEYGFIIAVIALGALAALEALGSNISTLMQTVATQVSDLTNGL